MSHLVTAIKGTIQSRGERMRKEKEDLVVLNQELEAWKHTTETQKK